MESSKMASSSDRALLIGSYIGNEDVGRAIARKPIIFSISKGVIRVTIL
jgi:hypothetical protein